MLRSPMIQYFLLASWIRLLYPQCARLLCRWRSSSLTSRWLHGRITIFLISWGNDLASSSRPWARIRPSSSRLGINFLSMTHGSKCSCLYLKSQFSDSFNSWTVIGPVFVHVFFFLAFWAKRRMYASVLRIFGNVEQDFSSCWKIGLSSSTLALASVVSASCFTALISAMAVSCFGKCQPSLRFSFPLRLQLLLQEYFGLQLKNWAIRLRAIGRKMVPLANL